MWLHPSYPSGSTADTLLLPFNDLEAAQQLFAHSGSEIAALIVEPIAGNMGCVPPRPGYLEGLRELTKASGALLIFDEVMTGFRVALGNPLAVAAGMATVKLLRESNPYPALERPSARWLTSTIPLSSAP